jgi:hypothetical protein
LGLGWETGFEPATFGATGKGTGGSPNDFRGFSTQRKAKKAQKMRVFNPSFSQVLDDD